ncbi:MAG TPA: ABC transporter permease/substrate-binding protein [Puia sp.]|nr:ABC transporter permease/substrate-binding protein [Puia sp.]
MDQQQSLWQFMHQESAKLLQQTLEHIGLTFISLLIAVLIGLPLGIYITRHKKAAGFVLGAVGILQTIPSIALLGFMIPLLGIGPIPAITALFLYALLPIIRNTFTGISNVDPVVKEAAVAMGMTNIQLLFKVELILAFPVIMAGIRTATVINVGVGTLAAYIAAGGLGEFIFGGIALNNTNMILAGAIPAALLAIVLDFLLSLVQKLSSRKRRIALWSMPLFLLLFSSFYILPVGMSSRLLAGFTPEFMGRIDGDIGLRSIYGLKIRTVVISDAVMYKAIFNKKLDVISGYSTDGRLKAYDLSVLDDDKKIFPPYYAAPVVRTEVLQKYKELAPVLNLLSGKINDSIMTELNYKVEYLNQPPEKCARDFLVAQGLYKAPRPRQEAPPGGTTAKGSAIGTIRLGSKIFPEQYILINMYAMLIRGYTDLQVETKTGLGGTKICFDALINNKIDMYPEYTGTALLAILHPEPGEIRQLGGNRDRVYDYVRRRFDEKYQLSWLDPIGFNNAYALMMRRGQAQQLHILSISDLTAYLDRPEQNSR